MNCPVSQTIVAAFRSGRHSTNQQRHPKHCNETNIPTADNQVSGALRWGISQCWNLLIRRHQSASRNCSRIISIFSGIASTIIFNTFESRKRVTSSSLEVRKLGGFPAARGQKRAKGENRKSIALAACGNLDADPLATLKILITKGIALDALHHTAPIQPELAPANRSAPSRFCSAFTGKTSPTIVTAAHQPLVIRKKAQVSSLAHPSAR